MSANGFIIIQSRTLCLQNGPTIIKISLPISQLNLPQPKYQVILGFFLSIPTLQMDRYSLPHTHMHTQKK